MKSLLYLVVLVLLITSASCTKFNETYRVTGTLYSDDEVTPLSGAEVTLRLSNTIRWNKYETTAATVLTDANGQFELTYKHDRKAYWADIYAGDSKLLLSGMGANENFHRDVCTKAVGYVHFDFDIQRELGRKDSLYVLIQGMEPFTEVHDQTRNILTYPFDELSLFEKVRFEWNRTETISSVRWGIGYNDYILNGSGLHEGTTNFAQIVVTGFPHIDTVNITIK